ncbi:MAG: 50S ribosomal protein L30 [Holosporaceae bacterium]|jgi:large subunit ribosomal protein L30|nr:50S ribosomal protein L30 [Holosporaceae bacterium]
MAKVKANTDAKTGGLCVVQTRGNARCERSQVLSLRALGLGKIGKKVFVKDDGCIRGLLRKVSHLVKIEDAQ